MKTPKHEMTLAEHAALATCEDTIQSTQKSFVACGKALAEIRDDRLYRAEHKTFEAYCQAKWGWTSRRAYMMIEGAEAVKTLPSEMRTIVRNEGQARALASVPAADRPDVLKAASAAGPVTAKAITEAAKPKEAIELDRTGTPIPKAILADWQHAEEVARAILGELSAAKVAVEKGLEDEDMAFREIPNTFISVLKSAHATASQIKPWAVCHACRGLGRSKCTLCKGRGFISKFRDSNCTPLEVKAMRKGKK